MALSFQWDPIAFRKATRGWRPNAIAVYRQIIDDLHMNDGSLSEGFLFDLWRDHQYDRRTWRKWVQFLIDNGKLRKNAEGEYINGRVARDHARITKRERDTVVHECDTVVQKPRKTAKQSSSNSKASDPLLQVTGIQDTGDRRTPPLIPPQGGCNQVIDFPPIPGFLVRKKRPPDFETWWQLYPRKVGKKAAERKYRIARQGVDAETLILGLQSYLATKPPDQAWCHPSTWLHQGRWEDVECEGKGASAPGWGAQAHLDAMQTIVEDREHGRQPGCQASTGTDPAVGAADDATGNCGPRGLAGPVRGNA